MQINQINSGRFYTLETESRIKFYQIPKIFSEETSKYNKLSIPARYLYGILRDRNSLSISKGWVDNDGRIYFLFKQEILCKIMGVKDPKSVRRYLKELENVDLLYRKKQGKTLPDKLYLLQVEISQGQSYQLFESDGGKSPVNDGGFSPVNDGGKSPVSDEEICPPNNTEQINKTKINKTERSKDYSSLNNSSQKEETILPNENIDLNKTTMNLLKKDRNFKGINFDENKYYMALIESIELSKEKDNIDIVGINQYSYFSRILLNKLKIIGYRKKVDNYEANFYDNLI